jgi:hypothetical protein
MYRNTQSFLEAILILLLSLKDIKTPYIIDILILTCILFAISNRFKIILKKQDAK